MNPLVLKSYRGAGAAFGPLALVVLRSLAKFMVNHKKAHKITQTRVNRVLRPALDFVMVFCLGSPLLLCEP